MNGVATFCIEVMKELKGEIGIEVQQGEVGRFCATVLADKKVCLRS